MTYTPSQMEYSMALMYLAFGDIASEEQRNKSPSFNFLQHYVVPHLGFNDGDKLLLPYSKMVKVDGYMLDVFGREMKYRPAIEAREVTIREYYNDEVVKNRCQNEVRDILRKEGLL